jgi:hypothetical protein
MPHDSGAVLDFVDSTGVGAVGAAVEGPVRFHSMTDHLTAAVGARRSQGMNRTLETIESV